MFLLQRFSRYDDFYDNWDGDWAWFDTNIDEDKEQFVTIEVSSSKGIVLFTCRAESMLLKLTFLFSCLSHERL